jgi:hypothetical protein
MIRKLWPLALLVAFACHKKDKTPPAADTKPADAPAFTKPSPEDCESAYANVAKLELEAQPADQRAGLEATIKKAHEDDIAACKKGDVPKARVTCLKLSTTPAGMVDCATIR